MPCAGIDENGPGAELVRQHEVNAAVLLAWQRYRDRCITQCA
jgi:hypothetical protein